MGLEAGAVEIRGGDPTVVEERARSEEDRLKLCYLKELRSIEGFVSLSWRVGPAGQVLDLRLIESDPGLEAVGACMAAKISRWYFPVFEDGQTYVEMAWFFRPAFGDEVR